MTTETTTETKYKCDDCGAEFDSENDLTHVHDGAKVCESCLEDYSFCEYLGEYDRFDNFVTAYNKHNREIQVSENALEANFHKCDDCGDWHENDLTTALNSRGRSVEICGNCYDSRYAVCDDCGDVIHCDFYSTSHDSVICNNCINDNYTWCECEDTYVLQGECECEEEEENTSLIKNYSYKPSPMFKGESERLNPFIGFELEIETGSVIKNECAELCAQNSSLYLKSDGSLDNGFEIVSHPSTLEIHKSENYGEIFKSLAKMGARSHDTKTCGLHFHLETKWMTENHKIRLGMFLTLCQPEFEILARRRESTYAQFKKVENHSDFKKWQNDDRYAALNWQNKHTVEFRIFKGTLKPETFFASMELCVAAYRFTVEKTSMSYPLDSQVIFKRFLKHVRKHENEYKNLIDYLKSKNFSV